MSQKIYDKNVFVLGAGFSTVAGAPLLHDFLERAREIHDNPGSDLDQEEQKHFTNVLEYRRNVAQAREKIVIDLDNIEHLFGLLEMEYQFGNRQLSSLRDSMVYMIAKTLDITTGHIGRRRVRLHFRNEESIPGMDSVMDSPSGFSTLVREMDIYDYFAALTAGKLEALPSQRDTIITLNYDLVVDHALTRCGVFPNYHLRGKSIADRRNQTPGASEFALLKLHGSANWGICRNCKGHIIIGHEKVTRFPDAFRQEVCPACGRQAFQPLLVPPSWNKTEYRDVIGGVWEQALIELKDAARICIIGYSIPESDDFFKYLLTLVLAQNHSLYRLVVVDFDPEASTHEPSLEKQRKSGKVELKYESLLDPLFRKRRFFYYGRAFENFLFSSESREWLNRGLGTFKIIEVLEDVR